MKSQLSPEEQRKILNDMREGKGNYSKGGK